MSEVSKSMIDINSLNFAYDNQPVLTELNLQLTTGQFVGLIGPNGAGKSTLLHLLLGLHKPQQGAICIAGEPLRGMSQKQLAKSITLVPQDAQINYAFSVEDVVAMGRNPWLDRFQPASQDDMAIVQGAMEQTDILQFAKRSVNQLSGGERQRVLIARAIAQQTPIIMLDEATANLDISHQLEVLQLAQSLAHQGSLVIAAIHDLSLAARYCDRLLLLAQQQLRADGTPDEVITEENLARYFNLRAEVQRLNRPDNLPGLLITPLDAVKPIGNSTIERL